MAFDPSDVQQISRLRSLIEETRSRHFDKFYKNYDLCRRSVRDPVHVDDEPDPLLRRPRNKQEEFFRITRQGIVDQNPIVRTSGNAPSAALGMFRTLLQAEVDRTGFSTILGGAVDEMLLRWSWIYCGHNADSGGRQYEPWFHLLDFNDCYIDQSCGTDPRDVDYMGHVYWARVEDVARNPQNDPAAVDAILKSVGTQSPRKAENESEPLYSRIDLYCNYLPREGLVVVLPVQDVTEGRALRVYSYVGPGESPYELSDFGTSRGTMIPLSRASTLFDQAEFVNRAARLLFMQASRAVEFNGYQKGNEQDADRYENAEPFGMIGFDNPDSIRTYRRGGVDQGTLTAYLQADSQFNQDAGNLNLRAGTAASAPTARQEGILTGGVAASVDAYRNVVQGLANRLVNRLIWFLLNDNKYKGPVKWSSKRGGPYTNDWTPELAQAMREANAKAEIIPGSQVSRSAEQQIMVLDEMIARVARTMSLPGDKLGVFKHREYLDDLADLGHAPELRKYFDEKSSPNAVVPGVEAGLGFGQGGGGGRAAPSGGGRDPIARLTDKMVYSAPPQGQQEQ